MFHILLVEDNPGDARLIRALLSEVEGLRFELVHVERLGDVPARMEEHPCSVVLLDLSLPDAHGLETVTRMHALAPTLPIVVLTGGDDETLALRAMHAGAQDYLVKGQVDGRLLARAMRYASERKRVERRFALLAEAGKILASSLELEGTLKSVARLAVASFADWCIVYVRDDDGQLRRQATAHVDPAREPLLQRLQPLPMDPSRPHPVFAALRSGSGQLLAEVDDATRAALAQNAEHRAIIQALDMRSVVVAPMTAHERTLGAIGFFRSRPNPYDADDLELAEELARRTAVALANARLYQQAQAATRARDEVLSVVSHDLGNSLSAMNVHARLLERYVQRTGGREEITERTQAIRSLVDQMHRLRQDLLDVASLEAGRLAVEPAPEDVLTLARETLDVLREIAAEKALRLVCEVAPGTPPVHADRGRLLQVLGNLLGNAVKFTPASGTITLSAAPAGGEVRFSVADTGAGIEPEHLPHVFDRFWQARHARRAGAGLGLAIARGIVEAHGGRIWVESQPGRGATFHFTVPAAPLPARAPFA